VPAFTFENAPKADVLVVPGGLVDDRLLSDQRLVQWIRQTAGSSEKVLSVCTGAFLLAQAGLLDGLKATTYHGAIGELAAMAPKARVVDDERFADNGKIVVAAGLSSGIDGALHVVEGIDGLGTAEATALNMEYDWNRKGTYVRASLPDKYIRFIRDAMPGAYVERDGDRSRWRDSWLVAGMASRDDAMVLVNRVASGGKGWRRLDASESKEGAPSHWAFEDDQGRKWSAVASVEPLEGSATQMIVSLEIGELSKGQ
jgi:putative intracellular protease/amidase